ncbi:MAG: roadblock/LC7 domain-containing protein [Pseudoclavibacter sp.]
MSRQDDLSEVIAEIRRSIPELSGVMIASDDGLPVAHDFPAGEADQVAAMAATALGLGGRVAERTAIGSLAESVFRGRDGYLVVYPAGDSAVLVLAGPVQSNLGLMRIEARSAAAKIAEALR